MTELLSEVLRDGKRTKDGEGCHWPVPVSVMVEGLLGSESVITSEPGRVPVAFGVKSI
jgi:hypothetical protein